MKTRLRTPFALLSLSLYTATFLSSALFGIESKQELRHRSSHHHCNCKNEITTYGSYTAFFPVQDSFLIPSGEDVAFPNAGAIRHITPNSSFTQFTVSEAGIYLVEFSVTATTGNANGVIQLFVNGQPISSGLIQVDGTLSYPAQGCTFVALAANDVLSIRNIGSNILVNGQSINNQSVVSAYLDIERVGPYVLLTSSES